MNLLTIEIDRMDDGLHKEQEGPLPRRQARILRTAGADPDHPVHPALPESAYLKALVLSLD